MTDQRLRVGVALYALFWSISLYPGELAPDTLEQYKQGASGAYTDAHPALLSWLLGRSVALTGSTGPLFLMQLGLGALGLAGLVGSVPKTTRSRVAFALLTLLPVLWSQLSVVLKDAWTTALLLDAIALIALDLAAPAALVVGLACCFRHNAITLAPALAALAAWPHRAHLGRAIAIAGLVVGCGLAAPRIVDRLLDVANTHPAAPSLVYDVTGVYVRAPSAYASGPFTEAIALRDVVERYDPVTARRLTSNKRGLKGLRHRDFADDARYAVLEAEWRRAVTGWPGAWIRHRAAFTANYLAPWPFEAYNTTIAAARKQLPTNLDATWRTFPATVLRALAAPFANGLLWTVGVLVLGGIGVRRRDALAVGVALAALGNLAGNVLFAPSTPFRYHLPSVVAVIVLLPRALATPLPGPARATIKP